MGTTFSSRVGAKQGKGGGCTLVSSMKSSSAQKVYDPVWQCIYCGAPHSKTSPLGREHIIPFCLGGHGYILPRSSCKKCTDYTGKFEEICARDFFGSFRVALGGPTRNPDQRPKSLPVTLVREGNEVESPIPIEQYPYITLILPQLGIANLMTGEPWQPEPLVALRSMFLIKQNVGSLSSPGAAAEILGKFQFPPFLKLLCKMAHSFAVAEHGLGSHKWLLPQVIIGKGENYTDYVGGLVPVPADVSSSFVPPGLEKLPQVKHWLRCVNIEGHAGKRFLGVRIQLFFDFAPPYLVIVGEVPGPIS